LLVARPWILPRLPSRVKRLADWSEWLCVQPVCPDHAAEVALLRSDELSEELGLPELQLLVSGDAAENGATLTSGSFKEFEAIGTLSRFHALGGPFPVIASAGNSALAALEIGSRYRLPAVLVVPEGVAMDSRSPAGAIQPLVIRLRQGGYADAKTFAADLVRHGGGRLLADGGYRNVARRQGLALPFLSAIRQLGRIPDVYVQAVGSGCGALAVLEASRLLIASGLGHGPPRLLLVQNHPYAPIAEAYAAGGDELPAWDPAERSARIRAISARVLSSADIPYHQPGGLRQALLQTNGLVMAVTNRQIAQAQRLLLRCLNLRVCEASGAALAGLALAIAESRLHGNAHILLHLTGTRSSGQAGAVRRHSAPILELPADRLQEALPLVLRYAERTQTPELNVS
jgi:cysteate synthase